MGRGLTAIDLWVIAAYFVLAILLGLYFSRRAGKNIESFFVGDRNLPWWLAGTSMVATTFAADTPLAVTGIVAADGIAGNWLWWCWAIAHLSATFFFARLWRRSGVITDAEIVEFRYSGPAAAALRGFKAVYFGLLINCLTMAWVIAAMVKISRAFFVIEPVWVIVICLAASVLYTSLGGFRSVVVTDLVQFTMGMVGAVVLAWFVVREFGGLGSVAEVVNAAGSQSGDGLLGALAAESTQSGRPLGDLLEFIPSADHPSLPPIYFLVLLFAGWWRMAEGQGSFVQRLAACKDERHAQGASLWFAVAHNALRPWPWILVGLAALVIYPMSTAEPAGRRIGETVWVTPAVVDLAGDTELRAGGVPPDCDLRIGTRSVAWKQAPGGELVGDLTGWPEGGSLPVEVFCSDLEPRLLGQIEIVLADRELAYPLIVRRSLPPVLLGLVVASLLAAFMSTIDTHTNWGASYLVQDLYQRFVRPEADPKHYVAVSRATVVLMAVLAGVTALFIQNIATVWRFLITLGAGLGSVTAARWYWPRVTPHAEFAALGVTTVSALGLEVSSAVELFGRPNPFFIQTMPAWSKILLIAALSLAAWVPVALWGPQNSNATLRRFANQVRPPGPGWRRYLDAEPERLGPSAVRFAAGLVVVYGALFGAGALLLGRYVPGVAGLAAALVATFIAVAPARREAG